MTWGSSYPENVICKLQYMPYLKVVMIKGNVDDSGSFIGLRTCEALPARYTCPRKRPIEQIYANVEWAWSSVQSSAQPRAQPRASSGTEKEESLKIRAKVRA